MDGGVRWVGEWGLGVVGVKGIGGWGTRGDRVKEVWDPGVGLKGVDGDQGVGWTEWGSRVGDQRWSRSSLCR